MPAQSRRPNTKTAPPPKPLAWWKKLLIAVFGTYIAAKFFGILIPDVSAAGILPHTDGNSRTDEVPPQTDEYPDDTWDIPYDDPPADTFDAPYRQSPDGETDREAIYNDWGDWNDGYDDDDCR